MKKIIFLCFIFTSCQEGPPPTICQQLLNQRKEEVSYMNYNYTNRENTWIKQIERTDSLITKYCK